MKKNILFAVLMCWSLFLMAGKKDYFKSPKYLLGAVPEVNGIVTFQKSFSVTNRNEQQIYDIVLAYVKDSLVAGGIQFPKSEYTRVISEERENGTIVARVEEYMTFSHVFFNLDRTRFRYRLSATVRGQKVSLVLTQVSYYYNEDMDGNNGIIYKAEEWITDKYAVNRKGTGLYPRSSKFRCMTIDRVQTIFNGFMDAFSALEARKNIVEE